MKIQIYSILLVLSFGCVDPSENSKSEKTIVAVQKEKESTTHKQQKNNNLIDNLEKISVVDKSENYESVKRLIEEERRQLISKDLQIDSIGKIFKISLLNKIIPFWEGTKWSFEGHTQNPKSGRIACGYFVSTTLQDIGVNLNRYKLAQQNPFNEAKSLAINIEVKEFSESSIKQNIAAIKEYLKEGIHFIGFDQNHVGYILKEKDNLYLIHSNYINAVGVEIEQIEQSEVFKAYNKYYIVALSTNENLLKNWINGKRIQIVE